MSRPIGSACCDWTVEITDDFTFICDKCEKECEVSE